MDSTMQGILEMLDKETVDGCIAAYKAAKETAKQYNAVAEIAMNTAQRIMEDEGVSHVKTTTGTAGWTKPKPRLKLDVKALEKAARENPEIMDVIKEYYREVTQKKRFYIR